MKTRRLAIFFAVPILVMVGVIGGAAPSVIRAIADSGSVVWLDVWNCDCPAGATGVLLENGSILSAGHLFWCGEDPTGPNAILTSFNLSVGGEPVAIAAGFSSPNPAVAEALDLALVKLAVRPRGVGVSVAPIPESGFPFDEDRGLVWIIGYRMDRMEVVGARVIRTETEEGVTRLVMSVKDLVTYGFSGSPVLDNRGGRLVGIVVAKNYDGSIIYATYVSAPVIDMLMGGP